MPLTNTLKKVVDLPVWEWTRPFPVAPTAGLACSCVPDSPTLDKTNGRFIYQLYNATNFWRYDTVADSYQQLASPLLTPTTVCSMRFSGTYGYYNKVLDATSTTLRTGLPSFRSPIGYKIRIIAGKGVGQERIITDVSEPQVADFGNGSAGGSNNLQVSSKNWAGYTFTAGSPYIDAYTGTTRNSNGWIGFMLNLNPFGGTTGAQNQIKKILSNSDLQVDVASTAIAYREPFALTSITSPSSGNQYQIESSVLTVDTAWDVIPDKTSEFMIQSGSIILLCNQPSGLAPFHILQYYDILGDTWYQLSTCSNVISAAPTELSLERTGETSTIWCRGKATGGTSTTLTDSTVSWTTDQWVNHKVYIFSGTGRGQIADITSNTGTTLTFGSLSTAPDSTSRYEILGYDGGKSTGSNTYNTLIDTSKSWETNRWKNYAIRILAGKGAGQQRRILSNTGTTLTFYRGWNVMPDNTSVYSIQGDSEKMYISWGGSAQITQFSFTGNANMTHTGNLYDYGAACIAAALKCDSNHNIDDVMPTVITGLAGTTTITATAFSSHPFKVGDWVSIRGVTSSTADQYNVTGLVQVTSVPQINTFTYTPYAAGSGTYSYLPALSSSNLSDASKDFRDNVLSSTNTTITFARVTPSNINGWYVTGTNVSPGARVVSGAGTTTLTLSEGVAAPSGVIIFNPWGPTTAITSTYSSGGGAGVATITFTANTNANINGWYVSGTGIPPLTYVTSGAGTNTIVLSNACTGAVSGTVTFYPPEVAGKLTIMTTSVYSSGNNAQINPISSPLGGTTGFLGSLTTAPVAGTTKYIIQSIEMLGMNSDGNTVNYMSGVASSGGASSLVDTNAFWATATGSGSAQSTTITLSAVSPGSVNGWFISGTGINGGSRIISGAGTNTLTIDTPTFSSVSGTISCYAYGPSSVTSFLTGKRLRILANSGANQELAITACNVAQGNIAISGTAPAANSIYCILSAPLKSTGHELSWAYGNSTITSKTRGRYLWCARGGAVPGIDKIDLSTERVTYVRNIPWFETLTTGSWYAYDGMDKIWFTKDATQRIYYLDVNTGIIYGGGIYPYVVGTAQLGNRMEVITTEDGLKYLWINRHGNVECYRALIYY